MPGLQAHGLEWTFGPDSRIVDEDVQAAKRFDRFVDDALRILGLGDVRLERQRPSAARFDLGGDRFHARDIGPRQHGDRRAAFSEIERDGAPDIARRARDNGNRSFQFLHAHPLAIVRSVAAPAAMRSKASASDAARLRGQPPNVALS